MFEEVNPPSPCCCNLWLICDGPPGPSTLEPAADSKDNKDAFYFTYKDDLRDGQTSSQLNFLLKTQVYHEPMLTWMLYILKYDLIYSLYITYLELRWLIWLDFVYFLIYLCKRLFKQKKYILETALHDNFLGNKIRWCLTLTENKRNHLACSVQI